MTLSVLARSPGFAVFAVALAPRLLLLDWYESEYTDGVMFMSFFSGRASYWPPLYPVLLALLAPLGLGPLFAGRLISIVAASLACVVCYRLGARVFSTRVGVFAGLLLALTPMSLRWSPRVMSDALFALLMLSFALVAVPRASGDDAAPGPPRAWLLSLIAGLCTLTRWQGFALAPLVGLAVLQEWRAVRARPDAPRAGSTRRLLLAALPWAVAAAWIAARGLGHLGRYTSTGKSVDLRRTLSNALANTEVYLQALGWGLTWPVAVGAVAGFVVAASLALRSGERHQRLFVALVVYLGAVWVLAHAPYRGFQLRYFLPLAGLGMVFAGLVIDAALRLGRPALTAAAWLAFAGCLATSTLMSWDVLQHHRHTFAGFRRAGEAAARLVRPGARIYANETQKTAFWAGRRVAALRASSRLAPGDLVIAHDFHERSVKVAKLLAPWPTRVVFEHRYATRAILPDVTIRPLLAAHRRWWNVRTTDQRWVSRIYEVTGPRATPAAP